MIIKIVMSIQINKKTNTDHDAYIATKYKNCIG